MSTTTTTSQKRTNGTHKTGPGQLPLVPHFIMAKPTKEALDFADLPIVNLVEAKTDPTKVAEQVHNAMTTQGFLYIVNHGYSAPQMQRMFDIADVTFKEIPEEEKKSFDSKPHETGSFQGYKLRRYWHLDEGVKDQIEMYSINKDVTRRLHPNALQLFLPEIDAFARHNYFNVVHLILRLLAIGMELPENTFVKMHNWSKVSESIVRFTRYHHHSEEDEAKTNGLWFKGYTDFGFISLIYSQPVSGLQILGTDGKWRWIKHIDNAIIMNAGDSLEFLCGGLYKATIHRVVKPPSDQRTATRLDVYFFAHVDEHVKLAPLTSSPVLQRVGVTRRSGYTEEDAPTMKEWMLGRTLTYGQTKKFEVSKDMRGDGMENRLRWEGEAKVTEEAINGVVVKRYN
ncbi:Clavaminate synthase-like protein [Marasmius fiardii PR-910]|nr:Clavaminate synthase-like protein [Marasmius fiardii PR-910]